MGGNRHGNTVKQFSLNFTVRGFSPRLLEGANYVTWLYEYSHGEMSRYLFLHILSLTLSTHMGRCRGMCFYIYYRSLWVLTWGDVAVSVFTYIIAHSEYLHGEMSRYVFLHILSLTLSTHMERCRGICFYIYYRSLWVLTWGDVAVSVFTYIIAHSEYSHGEMSQYLFLHILSLTLSTHMERCRGICFYIYYCSLWVLTWGDVAVSVFTYIIAHSEYSHGEMSQYLFLHILLLTLSTHMGRCRGICFYIYYRSLWVLTWRDVTVSVFTYIIAHSEYSHGEMSRYLFLHILSLTLSTYMGRCRGMCFYIYYRSLWVLTWRDVAVSVFTYIIAHSEYSHGEMSRYLFLHILSLALSTHMERCRSICFYIYYRSLWVLTWGDVAVSVFTYIIARSEYSHGEMSQYLFLHILSLTLSTHMGRCRGICFYIYYRSPWPRCASVPASSGTFAATKKWNVNPVQITGSFPLLTLRYIL